MPVLFRISCFGPVCLLFASALLCAGQETKVEYFSVAGVPEYQHPERALAVLVRRDAKVPINHFCMVGVRFNGKANDYVARVYWKENNTLTLWEHWNDSSEHNLLHSRRVWHLNSEDVVPAAQDQGSPFAIHKEEVDETLAACERLGQKFVIRRTRPSKDFFPLARLDQDKSNVEKALSALVQRDAKVPINHFCVVGFQYGRDNVIDLEADVYWRENHTIIRWFEPPNNIGLLLEADRIWDLRKDVATTEQEIQNNKFVAIKEEVDATLAACERIGQKFVIQKTPPGAKNGSPAVSSRRQ